MLALALMTMMVAAVVVLFPETKVARSLTHRLIEAPARWLNRTAVWRIAFYSALVGVGIVMTLLFEAEGLIVYGFMAPEILAWAVMFDVGVMIDALLITAAVLASNGLKVARIQGRVLVDRLVTRVRACSASRTRKVRSPGSRGPLNSDDDRPALAGQPAYRAFSMA
ncbi:hypothetical protein [Brevundimonas sp.]|uniref:hypothetical protein n=1 Tax=Brevundimonas sp. TaxID=1871086 RepID=UPI00286CF7EB|nr:hypothetical protein [Brevundimonas sp.]